jgi:xanthine/uracil permease
VQVLLPLVAMALVPFGANRVHLPQPCSSHAVAHPLMFCPLQPGCLNADGSNRGQCFDEAYGKALGTILLGGVLVFALSFMSPKVIRRVFPPLVNGVTILLIGLSLVKSGTKYWGGGAFCHDNVKGQWGKAISNCTYIKGNATVTGTCFEPATRILCSDAGDVRLPYGHPVYLGLGFVVFCCMILFELFGSPFMRNCAVALSLIVGFIVAAAASYDGKRFVTSTKIDAAPVFAFLWIKTFPLGGWLDDEQMVLQ